MRVRVSIVHDCALTRRALASELSGRPGLQVTVGSSLTGLDTDVLVVDLRLAGRGRLGLIHRDHPDLPIVLLARSGSGDPGRALDALLAAPATGVLDVVPLPPGREPERLRQVLRDDLAPLLQSLAAAGTPPAWCTPLPGPTGANIPVEAPRYRALVIGSGRTSMPVLAELLASLPPDLPVPVTVAQQLPAGFETVFAQKILARSAVPVRLSPEDLDDTFRRAAYRHGRGTLGVLLGGPGRDGLHGVTAVREVGGTVLAQAEEPGRIWGIPGAAALAGQVDRLVPADDLAAALTVLLAVALTPHAPAATGRHAHVDLEVQPA